MRPHRKPKHPQGEMFQVDLEQLIDMHHPLVVLGQCIDWGSLEAVLGGTYHSSRMLRGSRRD